FDVGCSMFRWVRRSDGFAGRRACLIVVPARRERRGAGLNLTRRICQSLGSYRLADRVVHIGASRPVTIPAPLRLEDSGADNDLPPKVTSILQFTGVLTMKATKTLALVAVLAASAAFASSARAGEG